MQLGTLSLQLARLGSARRSSEVGATIVQENRGKSLRAKWEGQYLGYIDIVFLGKILSSFFF